MPVLLAGAFDPSGLTKLISIIKCFILTSAKICLKNDAKTHKKRFTNKDETSRSSEA